MLNSSEDINNGLTRKRKLSTEDNNYEVIDMDISGVSDSNLEESQTELDEVTPMIKKKYLRNKTPESKVIRDKGWQPVLEGCNPNIGHKGCKLWCSEAFTEERRREINDMYWTMTYEGRSTWMANMVDTITPVRPRKNNTKGEKERKVTRLFYLITNNREKICVYNKMFLVMLG